MQKPSFPELWGEPRRLGRRPEGHALPRVRNPGLWLLRGRSLRISHAVMVHGGRAGCVAVFDGHYRYTGTTLRSVHVIIYNEYTKVHMLSTHHTRVMIRNKKRADENLRFTRHAARPAAHLSSINCNLSPSPSKKVICNSDPVQWGTIEA